VYGLEKKSYSGSSGTERCRRDKEKKKRLAFIRSADGPCASCA
jgi:hypothetical protein